VVYGEPDLGFAVQFDELSAEQATALKAFLHPDREL
jgi:hypothetical protein